MMLATFRIAALDGHRQRLDQPKVERAELFRPVALLFYALQVQLVGMHHPIQHRDHQQSDLPAVVAVGNGHQTGRAPARDVMRKRPEEGLFPAAGGKHRRCSAADGEIDNRGQHH
jgi:hypothetical protein